MYNASYSHQSNPRHPAAIHSQATRIVDAPAKQSEYTRDETIQKLATSMGVGDFTKSKYSEPRFDAETGTLYCNGMMISPNIAQQTIKHFEHVYKRCNLTDPMEKELALMYRCAIESMKMMQHPMVRETLGRLNSSTINDNFPDNQHAV